MGVLRQAYYTAMLTVSKRKGILQIDPCPSDFLDSELPFVDGTSAASFLSRLPPLIGVQVLCKPLTEPKTCALAWQPQRVRLHLHLIELEAEIPPNRRATRLILHENIAHSVHLRKAM
jgi:hypothetical protein